MAESYVVSVAHWCVGERGALGLPSVLLVNSVYCAYVDICVG